MSQIIVTNMCFGFLILSLVAELISATPMQTQPEVHMDSKGKVLTSYFDQTSTAYFRPPQLVFSATPAMMQPMINYVHPIRYLQDSSHPPPVALMPPPIYRPMAATHLYDPMKPGQIIRTVQDRKHIPILRMASDFNYDGTFNYAYETGNGISAQTIGAMKNVGPDRPAAQVMHGTYSYVSPEGTPISTTWYADETGFHAQGAHLPISPPIPQVIASSIDYVRNRQPQAIFIPS